MFFKNCKIIINNHLDYLSFINYRQDVLHNYSNFDKYVEDKYPIYVMMTDENDIQYTYDESIYNICTYIQATLDDVLDMKYIISNHFKNRFIERFDKVSNTRLHKLLSVMLTTGTWVKRKDAFQALKYKKTSEYVVYSQYEDNKKVYYLIIITNGNIITTIYEFNIKDMKYFKES